MRGLLARFGSMSYSKVKLQTSVGACLHAGAMTCVEAIRYCGGDCIPPFGCLLAPARAVAATCKD